MLQTDRSPEYFLYGDASSIQYQSVKFILENNRMNPTIRGMLPCDFQRLKHDLQKAHLKTPYHHFTKDYILLKDKKIADLDDLKIDKGECDPLNLKQLAKDNLYKLLQDTNNHIVELEMRIHDVIQEKIIIQLFNDITPKTVSKFLELVAGNTFSNSKNIPLTYVNSKVSRVLADGWIQLGEIRDENGSIVKENQFEDENFVIHHDSPGIISMVNAGPHSNFSTFMINCGPMPFFDFKYVAFGKVVKGQEIVDKISRIKSNFEKPVVDVVINSIKQMELK